jgi:hypothetical protein
MSARLAVQGPNQSIVYLVKNMMPQHQPGVLELTLAESVTQFALTGC